MPRIHQKRIEYAKKDFAAWLYGKLKKQKVKQYEMAENIDCSAPNFNIKLKSANFDYGELVRIFEKLQFTDEDIVTAMRGKFN